MRFISRHEFRYKGFQMIYCLCSQPHFVFLFNYIYILVLLRKIIESYIISCNLDHVRRDTHIHMFQQLKQKRLHPLHQLTPPKTKKNEQSTLIITSAGIQCPKSSYSFPRTSWSRLGDCSATMNFAVSEMKTSQSETRTCWVSVKGYLHLHH
jgi:hypothetical protein